MAAAAGPSRVQQVLLEVQGGLESTFREQLHSLDEARRQHSHSDILLPPDLTSNLLATSSHKLKQQIVSIIDAAYPRDPEEAQTIDANAVAATATLSQAGLAVQDIVRAELMTLFARKIVFADVLDKSSTMESIDTKMAKALYDRLDVILALEVSGVTDNSLALTLHHEVLDRLSVSACRQHFDYIESRVADLTKGLLPSKGKGLVLLRMCNELLRRLSKPSSSHTIFAGRILTFLSSVFPLGERSGVNLRGDFNVDNKTLIEPAAEAAGTGDGEGGDAAAAIKELDAVHSTSKALAAEGQKRHDETILEFARSRTFYRMFWASQQYFSNPAILVNDKVAPISELTIPDDLVDPAPEGSKDRMQVFRRATRRIYDVFGAVQRREKELAGQIAAEKGKSGTQARKRPTGHAAGAGEDLLAAKRVKGSDDGITASNAVQQESFFPKYLTGSNLLEYELRDASFRRHVLVQYLIFFQYLLSFTPANREKAKTWKNAALAHSMSYALDESDERWIRDIWRETLNLIRDTSAEGRNYALSVLQILRHEGRWIDWKTDSCPPIDKLPMSNAQMKAFLDARKIINRPLRPYPFPLGTAALSRLWEDGVKPPEPSTRTMEDDSGMEVQVQTDGLDELEMGPQIPSLESYASQIRAIEEKQAERHEALGWTPSRPYVIAPQIPAASRQQERERIVRDGNDEELSALEQRRNVLSWRALRLARTTHLGLFGKIQAEYTGPHGGTGIAVGMRIDDITGLMASVEKQEKGIPIVATAPPTPPKPIEATVVKVEDDSKEQSSVTPGDAPADERAATSDVADGVAEGAESAAEPAVPPEENAGKTDTVVDEGVPAAQAQDALTPQPQGMAEDAQDVAMADA